MRHSKNHLWVRGSAVLAVALLLGILPGAGPARAAGFFVNSTLDAVDANPGNGVCETAPGNGVCTLRAAVQEANASTGVADMISLTAGTYRLTIQGVNENASATGDLDITHNSGNLAIYGSSLSDVIIDGNGIDRVIDICCQTNFVRIEGVTIRNGRLQPGYLGFYNHSHGAGVHNHGELMLRNVTISDNTVDNSGSTATWGGGGLTNGCGRTPDPRKATCPLHAEGDSTLINVTVSGNSVVGSGKGGGIENSGVLWLNNVTLASNTAPSGNGGGIFNNDTLGGFTTIMNTIVASSPAGGNCSGTLNSWGYNLSSDTSCAGSFTATGDRNSANARLGPLQDNGGGTPTHAVLRGSSAIDQGNPAAAGGGGSACAGSDQRGVSRPQDGNGNGVSTCDIGAYELEPTDTNLSISYLSDSPDPVQAGDDLIYTIDVNNPGPERAASLRLVNTLPAQVIYTGYSETRGGVCSHAGGTVTCELGTLAGNRVWTVRLYTEVSLAASGPINIQASVTAVGTDPNPANNSGTETTTITPVPHWDGALPLIMR